MAGPAVKGQSVVPSFPSRREDTEETSPRANPGRSAFYSAEKTRDRGGGPTARGPKDFGLLSSQPFSWPTTFSGILSPLRRRFASGTRRTAGAAVLVMVRRVRPSCRALWTYKWKKGAVYVASQFALI
jgi:hypothetical protein